MDRVVFLGEFVAALAVAGAVAYRFSRYRAVRAVLTVQGMKRALAEAVSAQAQAIAALNGSQKGEAERILREMGVGLLRVSARHPADP